MAIDLSTHARDIDIKQPQFKTMLENTQANILKSHGRDFAIHLFLQFTGTPDAVKKWIATTVSPLVTSAATQYPAAPVANGGPVGGFYLSANGYRYLGLKAKRLESQAFLNGMKDDDDNFIEELVGTSNKDPKPATWDPGFRETIHALITLADDGDPSKKDGDSSKKEPPLAVLAASLTKSVAGVARIVVTELGNSLKRDALNIEHFGYMDGISQPQFTRQDLKKLEDKHVTGAAWDPGAKLDLVLVDDPFTNAEDAFGSYLVYRKLGQDVERFETSVKTLAAAMKIPEDLAGAYVVGRHKDGTPVVQSPTEVPVAPGNEPSNDFLYRDDDAEGVRCPFHSHIRKSNPRGTTPLTSLGSERSRRIARRAIPYGRPMPSAGVTNPVPVDPDPKAPRGLLFMCFQSSIEHQFEFITRTWVDNKHFPTAAIDLGVLHENPGDDPLIGQDHDAAQRWPKKWGDEDAGKKTVNFEAAVTLHGGEYFFAPSLPFLKSL